MCFLSWLKKKPKEESAVKYLIVGLGNIGSEYAGTRHNIGFEVVDYLAEKHSATWSSCSFGVMTKIKHKGRSLLLLKPDTYMNLSGRAVKNWVDKEKIPIANLLIVVDDLNLTFGKLRLRAKGSDGGHNGLSSIMEYLGMNFPRLRIGIGDDFKKGRQVDFVLGKWENDELDKLSEILEDAAKTVLSFCAIGISHTISQLKK